MKINYSEYGKVKNEYKKIFRKLSDAFETYIDAMVLVNKNGFISGSSAEGWVDFISYASKPRKQIGKFGKRIDTYIDSFLIDLDKDQKYNGYSILYDYSYPGMRDYSYNRFFDLKEYAEATGYDSDIIKSIFNGFENLYFEIKNLIPWKKDDNSKAQNIDKTQRNIFQWRDATKAVLKNIEMKINRDDELYSKKIEKIDVLQESLYNYFEKLTDIISHADPNDFSVEHYKGDLDKAYHSIMVAYNNVIVEEKITDDDVKVFIDGNNEGILDKQVEDVHEFLHDLSGIDLENADFWKLLIFQMFNISEGELSNEKGYDEYLRKAEIIELLEEIEKTSNYKDSTTNEIINELKKIIKAAKDSGQSVYEYFNTHRDIDGNLLLDGRTKEARRFRDFLNKFGKILTVLDTIDDGASIIYKLFVDYSKNIALLNSFEKNAEALSDEMKNTFANIRDMYEHELTSAINEALDLILSKGVNALYSISFGKIIGSIKETIGFVGDVTGESSRTDAQYRLLLYGYSELNAAESAFRNSYKALQACPADSKSYSECINDFKNCFSIYKSTLKRLFEKMALAANGEMREYYYYCSSQISQLTIKNYNQMKIMTFEEYKKIY